MKLIQHILVFCVRVYQWTLSPLLSAIVGPHGGCRFTPTCSHYAIGALREHGALRGSWLALKRLCRCHPWGGCGDDPVPEKRTAEFAKTAPLNAQHSTLNLSPARHGS